MSAARLNLITAAMATAGSIVVTAFSREVATGLIWIVASLVWLLAAAFSRRKAGPEPYARHRIGKRMLRLLMWS